MDLSSYILLRFFDVFISFLREYESVVALRIDYYEYVIEFGQIASGVLICIHECTRKKTCWLFEKAKTACVRISKLESEK